MNISSTQQNKEHSVRFSYLANCGLLIQCGATRILVDGLTADSSIFDGLSPAMERMMTDGCEPYDHIDLLLFTHLHDDHFDLEKTLLFLESHPETKVMLPSSITSIITTCEKDCSKLEARAIYMCDEIKAPMPFGPLTVGTLTVDYVGTSHITFHCPGHYCIKLSGGHEDLLFTSDMDFDQLPLLKERFALGRPQSKRHLTAFFNPIIMGREAWMNEVAAWNPEAIFIYHIPAEAIDSYGYRKVALRRFQRYHQRFPQLKLLLTPLTQ